MFIDIVLALVVLAVIFVLVVSSRSSEFHVKQQVTIAAVAGIVFALVNDLHQWPDWSPWAEMDPNTVYTYSGPEAGEGAKVAWAGNKKMGEGNMTIVESRPCELVRIRLEFIKPFPAVNDVEFLFVPQGNQTVITWTMTGHLNFVFKTAHLLMNMDKIVNGQFAHGLAKMKSLVENGGVTA